MSRIATACALVLIAAPALAHDFWIAPATFRPQRGRPLDVGLRVGEQFIGEPVGRARARLERFVAIHGAGEIPIPGVEGQEPAGRVVLTHDGLCILAYRSRRASLELEAAEFERYLVAEGLESIVALRDRRGERAKPGREAYSRCAKSLVQVGDGERDGAGFDRVLGLPLELVPRSNPLVPGDLTVRLLFEGLPLAGALVVALPQDEFAPPISARSDAAGQVRLPLDRRGVWLVKAVHMVPASSDAHADWESFWASLTFESQ